MIESHPASKKDILSSVPRIINKGLVGFAMLRLDFNDKVSSIVEEGYFRSSEATRAHSYATRASQILLKRDVDCPPYLEEIIEHRGLTGEFETVPSAQS